MQIPVTVTRPRFDIKPNTIQSLSRPTLSWTIVMATVIKELHIAKRYLPNLVGRLVGLSIRLAFLLLLASVASVESEQILAQGLSGRNLYVYVQGALLLFVFNGPTVWGPIYTVTNDLYNGTLEFLYSNPCSRYAYYVGTVMAEAIITLVPFLPFYLSLVIYSQVSVGNMLLILLVCVATLISLTAMGIMIALLAILWRQVGSIANVLGLLFEFLSGAYIPVTAFPQFAQYLAYLLPHTWGYDLIRYYSFGGTWRTILPVWQEWAALIVFAVIFTVLSRYLLKKVEQLAKQKGLHLI